MNDLNRDAAARNHALDRAAPDAAHPTPAIPSGDRHGLVFAWQPADVDGHPRLVNEQVMQATPPRRRPVLTGVVAAAIALFVWNYLVVSQAERWATDRAYAAAHESFGMTPADGAALAAAEQRLATAGGAYAMPTHEVVALEEARARAESRIRSARESDAQAGRNAASRTVDRTAFLMSSPEWFACLAALWLLALLPASALVGALFAAPQGRELPMTSHRPVAE